MMEPNDVALHEPELLDTCSAEEDLAAFLYAL